MGSDPLFSALAESRNGVARVALSGELDLSTVPVLEEQLSPFEQDGVAAIMLDLGDLTFTDSTGLHAFLQASIRAKGKGKRLCVVGASARMRHLFEMTRTDFLLDEPDTLSVMDQFTGSGGRRASGAAAADESVDA